MAGTFKAVVLARGLGVRMRRSDPGAGLDQAQAAAAIAGLKGMMPLNGHPFLDYVLTGLADAGYRDVCLVLGPEHAVVREWYGRHARPARVRVGFATQAKPLGTADAVLAAEGFAGSDRFLVVNADNYYPAEALRALRELEGPGLAAFTRAALTGAGNLTAERVARFPVVRVRADGALESLDEPGPDEAAAGEAAALVSMNCWMFTPAIFDASRAIAPSASGELELPEAVRRSARGGERFRVLRFDLPVLDLTARADVAAVATRLAGVRVHC
jgi:glucose-1-phosphate thymidylyltransferase